MLKGKFYYGWVIVAVAALGVFFSGPGQTYSVSVFINSYIEDFGWNRTFVSSMYSTATLTAGLLLSIIGRMIDRYGQRAIAGTIGIALGLACLFNSFIASPLMLFMGFFSIRLFGQGAMTLTPGTLVPQWFVKKRGMALSFMTVGGVLGSATLPPLNTWIINNWGWNSAWRLWAILLCLVFSPIAFSLIRNTPEEMGLLPDNEIEEKNNEKDQLMDLPEDDSWTLKEAMGTRAFWLILFCQAIPSMVNTGMVFHFISIMGEKGIPGTSAALVLSIVALVAFPSTFIAGFVTDRIKIHYVMGVVFAVRVLSLMILLAVNAIHLAVLFGIIHGVLAGFDGIIGSAIWPDYFGRKYLGSIRGFVMTATVIASAMGPLPFGFAYDFFGGYSEIIAIMLIFPVLATFASFMASHPARTYISIKLSHKI